MAEMIRLFTVVQIQSLRKSDNPKLVLMAKYAVCALNANAGGRKQNKRID